jgi:uncharacterized Fe-S center protein
MRVRHDAYGCLPMIVLALALSAVLLVGSVSYARAHSVKLEDGSTLTFDRFCCNEKDCAEVPLSAITQQGDGWAVDYISPKTGRHIRGFFREGAVGQKWSPNHQVFACESMMMNNDKTYVPRCIYPQRPGL